MSFVYSMIFNTLDAIHNECAKRQAEKTCRQCPMHECCPTDSCPEGWDTEEMTERVYEIGWERKQ